MIHRVVYVVCDFCKENPSADAADLGATATEQREEIRADGWRQRPGGVDICPNCIEEGK